MGNWVKNPPEVSQIFDVNPLGKQGRVFLFGSHFFAVHYDDVIMGTIASQITRLMIVYSTVYSDADQRKHQSSASLAFVRRIHRGPVNSPHKLPVTRKMFPFDDVIMYCFLFGQFYLSSQFSYDWHQNPLWKLLPYLNGESDTGYYKTICFWCHDMLQTSIFIHSFVEDTDPWIEQIPSSQVKLRIAHVESFFVNRHQGIDLNIW